MKPLDIYQVEENHPSNQTIESRFSTKTLIPFLLITFGLTWGLASMFFLFYDQVVAVFGEISMTNPLFILAVYSPGIAGVSIVLYKSGLCGLVNYLKRLTLWRAPLPWWLFLLFGIPALVLTGAALLGSLTEPFPFNPWYQVIPAMVVALFIGPIEEFGWRGLALPLLQRKFTPFWAGLILGVIWATWHIPAFLLSGTPQSAWSFGPYFVGVVTISIILTSFFNASRGSLLLAALYHFQMMNPAFPDAQPWDTLMFILAAMIIVWLDRKNMFTRQNAVVNIFISNSSNKKSVCEI